MKKVLISIFVSLIISSSGSISNHYAYAGSGASRAISSEQDTPSYVKIISTPSYFPWYSEDGGRAYYNAWHDVDKDAF